MRLFGTRHGLDLQLLAASTTVLDPVLALGHEVDVCVGSLTSGGRGVALFARPFGRHDRDESVRERGVERPLRWQPRFDQCQRVGRTWGLVRARLPGGTGTARRGAEAAVVGVARRGRLPRLCFQAWAAPGGEGYRKDPQPRTTEPPARHDPSQRTVRVGLAGPGRFTVHPLGSSFCCPRLGRCVGHLREIWVYPVTSDGPCGRRGSRRLRKRPPKFHGTRSSSRPCSAVPRSNLSQFAQRLGGDARRRATP